MYAKRCDYRYQVKKKFNSNDLAGMSLNFLISYVIIYDVVNVEI